MWSHQTSVAKTMDSTTPRAAIAGFGVEFRPFLQSELWEEKHGAPLSILSALARLDLDPWEEAARLALLPRETASERLSSLLLQLPGAPAGADGCDPPWAQALGLLPNSSVAAPSGKIVAHTSRRRWILIFELAYFGSLLACYAITVTQLHTVQSHAVKPPVAARPIHDIVRNP